MPKPTSPSDGSVPLNRRDLLRLGAASAGIPLIALTQTHLAGAGQPTQVNPEAAPMADAPPLEGDDHPEARAKTIDNLKTLGLAMSGYAHANEGRFPPAAIRKDGKPLLSWRVAILPFLDIHRDAQLYRKFRLDEPWDSSHNKSLLKEMPPEYAPVAHKDVLPDSTYYQGFVGPGALFYGPEGTKIADVTDGVAWTLMVAEAAEPVPWTKPEDLPFDKEKPLPRIGGQFEDGVYVAFADGSARFLSRKVSPETLRALITCDDGKVITLHMLGLWRRPRQPVGQK
jgi:Protein of unknown function (DUF1559)